MQIRARRILVSELAVSWNTTMEDAGERVDLVLAEEENSASLFGWLDHIFQRTRGSFEWHPP